MKLSYRGHREFTDEKPPEKQAGSRFPAEKCVKASYETGTDSLDSLCYRLDIRGTTICGRFLEMSGIVLRKDGWFSLCVDDFERVVPFVWKKREDKDLG
ncbi:hypothetical protein AVEN_274-1 [Araneus ventricosus]|uniref:Uncharacterized protein n=1 Tax=Araneus ventricosus TaxID=182803 RepID=A0A4Y2CQ37_ARAVE|nr:hypothetical protein AVEN_274-1 [Araneus ventricosus]